MKRLIMIMRHHDVVEFLNYECTMTTLNSPAAGMTSSHIGVSEISSTPVGCSL